MHYTVNKIMVLMSLLLSMNVQADNDICKSAYLKKDFATALKTCTPLARQGDAYAQTSLGSMYGNGDGVKQDYSVALKWFRQAAEQGFARAQYDLGFAYANGYGVQRNDKMALKWFRLAAEQKYAPAQKSRGKSTSVYSFNAAQIRRTNSLLISSIIR